MLEVSPRKRATYHSRAERPAPRRRPISARLLRSPIMKRVMVRYTVKPGRAAENERHIEQVFAELARIAPAGVQYSAFKLDDGVTFVHVYSHESDGGAGLLPTL